MGSPAGEIGRDADEGPVHAVRVPGFWMGAFEVSQDQYTPFRFRTFDGEVGAVEVLFDADAVTRPSPPYEDPGHGLGAGDHPSAGMTRYNALHYARWVWQKTGRFVRLPTEAEWEYACRAGGTPVTVETGLAEQAWFDDNSRGTHHPVGAKAPNAWGLHDMRGNVAEWVLDGYDDDAYSDRGGEQPTESPHVGDPVRGRGVVRGGAFDDPPQRLRCAERLPEDGAWKRRDPQIPKSRWWNTDSPHVGFRLVLPSIELAPDEARAWFDGVLGGPSGGTGPTFDHPMGPSLF
jgi:formylglycine-generating enzyme required for sulfatase activity